MYCRRTPFTSGMKEINVKPRIRPDGDEQLSPALKYEYRFLKQQVDRLQDELGRKDDHVIQNRTCIVREKS